MSTRSTILAVAARLLAESPDGVISTRAVREAAGVQQPVLYRHFADKDSLLAAAVDFGFEQYLSSKRAVVPSGDPVQDLRNGWDGHVAFAVENPNYYKLMYSPSLRGRPEAAGEAHRMLTAVVERIAAAGRLTSPVPIAVQVIMSANTGVALSLLYRPELYPDSSISDRVRDAVIDAVTNDDHVTPAPDSTAASLARTATTLSAQLRETQPATFSNAETALLQEWISRLERHNSIMKGN